MKRRVKICGLTTPEGVDAAEEADYIGFVFYPGSPRNITPQSAKALAARSALPSVAVTVDPNDALLGMLQKHFAPDYLQLHGNESVERVGQIKALLGIPIIKAFSVVGLSDIERAREFEPVADMLMFDAKTPAGNLPGGNGIAFDWKMLAGHAFQKPWFLSGGLTTANALEAIRISGADSVDVSSGVESRPGVKDPALVREFIAQVKNIQ